MIEESIVCALKNILYIFFLYIFITHAAPSTLSAGEGGEEMEGGVVGATSEDDGRKTVARRVKARTAAPGNCEEGSGRGGQGRGATLFERCNHMLVTAEEFSELSGN